MSCCPLVLMDETNEGQINQLRKRKETFESKGSKVHYQKQTMWSVEALQGMACLKVKFSQVVSPAREQRLIQIYVCSLVRGSMVNLLEQKE